MYCADKEIGSLGVLGLAVLFEELFEELFVELLDELLDELFDELSTELSTEVSVSCSSLDWEWDGGISCALSQALNAAMEQTKVSANSKVMSFLVFFINKFSPLWIAVSCREKLAGTPLN